MVSYLPDGVRQSRTRYFMRIILLLLTLFLLPFPTSLAADAGLYTGETVVPDQSAEERRRGLPRALGNVLIKISGLRNFDENPVVEPSLRRASSMVLSFHYRNAEVVLSDGSLLLETRLVAQFSQSEVDQLARELELPFWRPERMPLEVWLVVDDGLDRRIMPLEYDYIRGAMSETATMRGLHVVWPESDEEGMYPVDMQLLWGGYTEDLVGRGDLGVMILAARREGLDWGVRANLSYGSGDWAWRLQDIDLQGAMTESMQQAVDYIAGANTIDPQDLGVWQYELKIAGINSSRDYQRCLNFLQEISMVNQLAVVSSDSSSVTFSLELSASPRYLEETLARSDVIGIDDPEDGYFLLQEGSR